MKEIRSRVLEVGELAYFDEYEILILFNESAPVELRDVSIVHTFIDEPHQDMLKIGSKIMFQDQEYTIDEIGPLATEKLVELGHASFFFGMEEETQLLPGAILLHPHKRPILKAGDVITFIK